MHITTRDIKQPGCHASPRNLDIVIICTCITSLNIQFGFYWGSQIADPEKKLIGNGNQYRYFLVKNRKDFPKTYMKELLKNAFANSMLKIKDQKQIMEGKTIVKSISAVKRIKKTKKS